ncbi:MAG: hypothetical protein ACJA2S_001621 [Cyclobacteriaceae bacterium]|jgi:hypothetical protein
MHNIKSNFDKIYQTIKSLNLDFFNEDGNIRRLGISPQFSGIEVLSLVLTAEYMSLDSENWLFNKIKSDYKEDFAHLIDRSRYNRRKRQLFPVLEKIRQQLAAGFLEFEDYFIVDSMPLEVCKISREKRAKICKENFENAPDKGFCASQDFYFYGYKLQGVCSVNGIFHSVELTKASVHDVTFLKEMNSQLSDCVLIGDKGYLFSSLQLDLFHLANIQLETPMRRNQKNYKKQDWVFRKTRKRLETLFSQLCDQFMIRRDYAKSFDGFKTRILAKITALTVIQFINKFDFNRPINNLKVAIT